MRMEEKTFDEKMEAAASIAGMVFAHALKEAFDKELPRRIAEQLTDETTTKIGKSLANTLFETVEPFLNEYGDTFVKAIMEWIEGKYPDLKEFLGDEIPKLELEKVGRALIPDVKHEAEKMLDKQLRYRKIRIPIRWWMKLFLKDDKLEMV